MTENVEATPTVTVPQVVVDTGLSVGMGVFLMFMGMLSFPLPWTPVPFSMMPFALLATGVMQRPGFAALSVIIYLVAGGLGAGVFAEGESGWRHLAGATAGYLFGYVVVASYVSSYMQRPHKVLTGAWRGAVLGLVAVATVAGIAAIIWLSTQGRGFADINPDYGLGMGRSIAWIAIFLIAASTLSALLLRNRLDGRRAVAVHMFLVFLSAIILLHVIGVLVMAPVYPMPWVTAIIVGSLVFLPFDILKAALAVAVTLPFLPSEENHA